MVGVGILDMLLGNWDDVFTKMVRPDRGGAKVNEWKWKRKKKKEIEIEFQKQKDSAEYIKYEKDRREGRGEWYDDIEQGK